jgi:nucleotide-binding universal stress UspA family protein
MKVSPIIVGADGTESSKAAVMLGCTGLQLLHHADCPVYIVRARQ